MSEHTIEYWDRKYKLWRILHAGIWFPENGCAVCISHLYNKGIIGDLDMSKVMRKVGEQCPISVVPRLIVKFEDGYNFHLESRIYVAIEDCVEWIKHV